MKKLIFLIVIFMGLSMIFYVIFFKNKYNAQRGIIVLLNGPSAVGKSSLQKQFQQINDELYLTIGIDNFFDTILPDVDENGKSIKNNETIRWVDFGQDAQGHQTIALHVGPAGYRVVQGMHRAIAAYAEQNNNVIMDYILYDQQWLPDLVKALQGYKVYLIGVNAPLEVIEQRESKRGTSPIGHARSHYYTVHQNMVYDFEVDTSSSTADGLAQQIKDFIAHNPEPQALKQLSSKF